MDTGNESRQFAVVTPVCNEAGLIGRTIASMLRQTEKPRLWVIVDDGSSDATPERVRQETAGLGWIRLLQRPPKGYAGIERAEELLAFYDGVEALRDLPVAFIGKLDGDVELDPDYFARLLDAFEADPRLGQASGSFWDITDRGYELQRILINDVWGAPKLYRRECFNDLGVIPPTIGWDMLDVVRARTKGWSTRAFLYPRFFHNKTMGSRGGILRGKMRYGRTSFLLRYHVPYFLCRCLFQLCRRPRITGGLALLAGYVLAMLRREASILEDGERAELRRMQKTALVSHLLLSPSAFKGYADTGSAEGLHARKSCEIAREPSERG